MKKTLPIVLCLVLLMVMLIAVQAPVGAQNALTMTPAPTDDYSSVYIAPTQLPATAWTDPVVFPQPQELPQLLNHAMAVNVARPENCMQLVETAEVLSCTPLQSTKEHPFSYSRIDNLLLNNQAIAGFGDLHYMVIQNPTKWVWGSIDTVRADIGKMIDAKSAQVGANPELIGPDLVAITGFVQNLNVVVNESSKPVKVLSVYPSSGSIDRFVRPYGQVWTPEALTHIVSKKFFDIVNPGRNTEYFNQQQQFDVATNVPNCTLTLEEIAAVTGADPKTMDMDTFRATMAKYRGIECPGFNVTVTRITDSGPVLQYFGVYVRYLNPSWIDLKFLLDPAYDMNATGIPSIATVTPTPTG